MKHQILQMLKENKTSFVSGQEMSNKFNISRAAIWKYINQLKEDGYKFESVSNKGYKLSFCPDILTYEELYEHIYTNNIGKKILHFDSIDSTNNKAKELAAKGENEGTIIISEEQTAGRGRLGRNWVSPKGKGIWMSIILKPDINPLHASKLTLIAAAAVGKALLHFGANINIKWPNDILINNKKVCGILTEMSAELNTINYLVLGIGINVNTQKDEFNADIKEIATSLSCETGVMEKRNLLVAKIINFFEPMYKDFINRGSLNEIIDFCKDHSSIIGKEISVIRNKAITRALALDINEDGLLLVKYADGKTEALLSGEISIREGLVTSI